MEKKIEFGDTSRTPEVGDTVALQDGVNREVVACEQTGVPMLNIDADQLKPGDLSFIKQLGLTISNPDTDKPIALGVDYTPYTFGHTLATFFGGESLQKSLSDSEDDDGDDESHEDDDSDDSGFFGLGSMGGESSFGGGSSFGGFGGGSFAGGGASGGF